jgi:chromosome segregation protein
VRAEALEGRAAALEAAERGARGAAEAAQQALGRERADRGAQAQAGAAEVARLEAALAAAQRDAARHHAGVVSLEERLDGALSRLATARERLRVEEEANAGARAEAAAGREEARHLRRLAGERARAEAVARGRALGACLAGTTLQGRLSPAMTG